MNNIEEKLWNFMDGSCSPKEHEDIARLIATDEIYRQKYEEILAFNQELQSIELEMPPMAFTYKVMEGIRTEEASKPLKATIDTRIIKGIAAFFILTIVALLGIALVNTDWSISSNNGFQLPASAKLPEIEHYFSGPALKAFLFFDVVLALFLFDGYLRKRHNTQQA
ncbi:MULTISPECIES: hypothetical protein [unclassified Mucilaginibacter]|uniref:hypothetical protein n=1 Tax=unclassified Mucilaginibacter TaxID=2617802 RepID=UPI0031F6E757